MYDCHSLRELEIETMVTPYKLMESSQSLSVALTHLLRRLCPDSQLS